jgi:putative addiction module component (TIGR02574 family)
MRQLGHRVIVFSSMADRAREFESKALKLPPKERARLAERLISSLDQETDPDAQRLWLQEAERRLDELESGNVSGVPADQVFEKARSTLR